MFTGKSQSLGLAVLRVVVGIVFLSMDIKRFLRMAFTVSPECLGILGFHSPPSPHC